MLEEKRPITEKLIIEIHKKLLENIDNRICFRTADINVFKSHFKTSPGIYVKPDINLLLKWYKDHKKKLHPFVLASIFHHKFEKIHPFYDGNGRTARLLMNLILNKRNIPIITVETGEKDFYMRSIAKGIKCFQNRKKSSAHNGYEINFYRFMISKANIYIDKLNDKLKDHRNFDIYIKTKYPGISKDLVNDIKGFFKKDSRTAKYYRVKESNKPINLKKFNHQIKVIGNISKSDLSNIISKMPNKHLKDKDWYIEPNNF